MRLKRIIATLIVLSMVLQMFCIFPASAEVGNNLYEYDGYNVEYTITNEWNGGQTVEIKIINTGEESILNWAVKCEIKGEISGLWNAQIYDSEDTTYIFKNCGWNYEIRPNEYVTFGYTLINNTFSVPEGFTSCSEREILTLGYSVDLNITNTWDTGVQGEIVITNTSQEPLEAWILSFDSTFPIENLWNARVLSNENNRYTIASESWTNPIAIGESLTIGFVGSKTPETAVEIGNYSLSVVVIDGDRSETEILDKLIISAYGGYTPETETIDVFWLSTVSDGVFEVLVSEDNVEYTAIGSVTDADSYAIPVNLVKSYIKIRQIANGKTAESQPLVVTKTEDGYIIDYIDTDNDGLYDYIEETVGSDSTLPDTDSDGLSDYEEIFLTNTDPAVYNSVDEDLSDADADCDNDGLSNIEEIVLGTAPLSEDSDSDALTDGDEINQHGTDPLKYDSDEDGANDGWETENGYDPLVFNELFEITKSAAGENISVSVDVALNGGQVESFEINEVTESPFLNSTTPGYIGSAFDFSVDGEISEATIKFTFDEALLGDNFIPVIYYFNEETQLLEKLETTVVGNTAIAKTTHFSQYILLNEYSKTNFEVKYEGSLEKITTDIVFVIDFSNSMEWNDPTDLRKELTKKFISNMADDDKAAVVAFYSTYKVLCSLTNNKSKLIASVDSLSGYKDGTNGSSGINRAISILSKSASQNKTIVFLTDGTDTKTSYSYDTLKNKANAEGIKIYTIALGAANEILLNGIASGTGGKFYRAASDVDLNDIYSAIEQVTIDRNIDSNNDGISDYFTKMLCENTIFYGTGAQNCFVGLSYDAINNDADGDYDNDGLLNGDEMNVVINEAGKVYITMTSYPTEEDSDGDELLDDEEYYLETKLFNVDTDKDGLSDFLEVDAWYDPLNANPDGDSYTDYEEWVNGTNPFAINLTAWEALDAFLYGGITGDWTTADNSEQLLGKVAFSFVPFVADARDYFANIFVNLDTGSAIWNVAGFITDLYPGAGSATDAAKVVPKVSKYISKFADDAPRVVEAIMRVGELFSKNEDTLAKILKALPEGVVDDIVQAVQKGEGITYRDYSKLKKALEEAGQNTDKLIDGVKFKNFTVFKKALGSPGENCEWHHLVEQCQSKASRSGFNIQDINTTANIRATPKEVHEKISAYYSSKPEFTSGKTVRDWLNGKSYKEQLEFGLKKWEEYMIEFGYSID